MENIDPNLKTSIDAFAGSFIFSKPDQAYASKTSQGSIRNTGVIGTAIYELFDPNHMIHSSGTPQAFPADNGYAPAPR